jgi:ribosomal protein S18 acetylase RimI-like enzyme
VIRPYEPRDYEDILYLQQICYTKPCTENELRAKLAGKCWVFEDEPLVVGCVILDGGTIWSVTVAENWRRKGVATRLLLEAEKSGLPLYLYTEPNSPGNRLYTKLGYTATWMEYDFYGPGLDAVLMVKQ